ncbi:MAG TPA: nucleoside triphosphate pyrophosphohydrolase [Gammaproteobacteria bacterium]|nr:nucleoside triphosphate pyrophosphohydrolase [Gammaproteobacteria bacterium]
MKKQQNSGSIENLLEIMAALRDPAKGCPWDQQQTFATIAPYTIEEAYEVADAIERAALGELAGELGDLLFQVVFHARMAEEAGLFDFADVVEEICTKMLRRHPHVFGGEPIGSAAEQTEAWEEIKREERKTGSLESVLADVPVGLPALTRASKLGRRAATVGFDWPEIAGVRAKVREELAELDDAFAARDAAAISAEVGDLLFSVANLCRHLELDPERCLRAANARFVTRFRRVEQRVMSERGDWRRYDLDALEALWQQAKTAE